MKKGYIEVIGPKPSETGITKVYLVVNKVSREEVGEVKWYGGWRRYAFFPAIEGMRWVAFDEEVLMEVLALLNLLNKGRQGTRKIV